MLDKVDIGAKFLCLVLQYSIVTDSRAKAEIYAVEAASRLQLSR